MQRGGSGRGPGLGELMFWGKAAFEISLRFTSGDAQQTGGYPCKVQRQVQAGDKSGSGWHVACWSAVGLGAIKQRESSGHGDSFMT